MFLKRLELQGFKTFASKTEFVFDSGITAIIGPNGSGKSNIADAMRWVMGEQSARPLRIKRSDDVIFAGSSGRGRVGMAEVSVTLDNSTRWLPVDFEEVIVTRRAYRSGENEYLVNKSRVRLRDVVDMLLAGNIGQNNYTVIGQGAIDAALSLRPEERRELFEEAADIKRYQMKRNDALIKLETTGANLVRISDLVAEITPRLQSLQHQAQRAHEQEQALQELKSYLAAWYVHRWNDAADGLRQAMAAEAESQRVLDQDEASLAAIGERLLDVRQAESELRSRLGDWHRQSSGLHAQAEALERRMAAARATLDATNRQRQETLDEIAPLNEQLAAQQQIAAETATGLTALLEEQEQERSRLQELEQQAAGLETRRTEVQERLEAAEAGVFAAASAIAVAESTLTSIAGRRQSLLDDIRLRQTQLEQNESSLRSAQQAIGELQNRLAAQDAEMSAQNAQRGALLSAILAARSDSDAAAALANSAREERRALELRFEALSRLHQSLAGYDAGVRSVLNASGGAALTGVVGTVASLLRVPSQYEAAISAAMGNHEQDIVMESWKAAEDAVEHLRQSRSGRATFLPLDVIHGRTSSERIEGGTWAADVIQVDNKYRSIAAYLLGRVLIVRELSTARRILDQPGMRSVSSIVTLSGDIVRPGGAITGGSPTVRSSGLLERERELAELPQRIAAAKTTEGALQEKLAATQSVLRQAEERLVAHDGRMAALRRSRDDQAGLLVQRQREITRWQQEISWVGQQAGTLRRSLAGLDAQQISLTENLALKRMQQDEGQTSLASLRAELATLVGSELAASLAEARTAVALADQELRARRTLLDNRQREAERLAAQIAAKERRAAELAEEAATHAAGLDLARGELRTLSAAIARLQQDITPAEQRVDALEKERTQLMQDEMRERARQAALERAHSQMAVDVQRARNELSKLQAQIEAEEGLGVKGFGLDDNEVKSLLEELAVPLQLSLGMPETRQAAQQTLAANPELIKRRVDALRAQLRRLGPVNPNAVAEYEESLKRYTFLSTQSDDLEKAVRSLKAVIAELDELMRTRFETTFEAVSREFRRFFITLFGGGSARLALTDPDDLSETGIEIVAQPPGKRLQSLALLSGGERALTATALLFAILTVNPTPFCVLDEVDAALDDANIGRFCDALRAMAERTQFIVITHNKGTMETASALYGISMSVDSTSQVLSLRLEDVATA